MSLSRVCFTLVAPDKHFILHVAPLGTDRSPAYLKRIIHARPRLRDYAVFSSPQAITCLAMHPDKAHVATGQEGSSPIVLVWDSASRPLKTKARLQLGADKNGVSQVRVCSLM